MPLTRFMQSRQVRDVLRPASGAVHPVARDRLVRSNCWTSLAPSASKAPGPARSTSPAQQAVSLSHRMCLDLCTHTHADISYIPSTTLLSWPIIVTSHIKERRLQDRGREDDSRLRRFLIIRMTLRRISHSLRSTGWPMPRGLASYSKRPAPGSLPSASLSLDLATGIVSPLLSGRRFFSVVLPTSFSPRAAWSVRHPAQGRRSIPR